MTNSRAAAGLAIFGAACLGLTALCGCGGPDIGGASRSGFDTGLSGGYGGLGGYGGPGGGGRGASQDDGPAPTRGTYARMEFSFSLPDVKDNPFDFAENDVQVTLSRPDGRTVKAPAFFDGGTTWRVRYTPDAPGRYAVARVALNGKETQPEKLEPREAQASGTPRPGFVRRDGKDRARLVHENGTAYYPIGMNVGWGDDVPAMLTRLGAAGGNWSRVWMCHWDGKNLDWVQGKKLAPGTLDLDAARKWDAIIDAAEKAGVYVQVVLQHHGQYSSTVNPNWGENPWNLKNGGWLSTPDEFFTNQRAAALTRAKYRYIVARYGASPVVLAWELFNEVEWTDAMSHKNLDEVAEWHTAMAEFLRKQDPNKHLVTSSSNADPAVFGRTLDYYQLHAYPPDALATVAGVDVSKVDRPVFFGEIGPGGDLQADDGTFLHRALWSSMMSGMAGAAQYWAWDVVERRALYPRIASAAAFLRASGLPSRRGLSPAAIGVQTDARATLSLSPGAGWATLKQAEIAVAPSGDAPGISGVPAFLQGKAHPEMGSVLTFKVAYPQAGVFAVHIGQSARAGARIVVSVDGQQAAERTFEAAERDTRQREAIEAQVPAGEHVVKVENVGADWVVVNRFTLSGYAPALGALGRAGKDFAAAWVYRRAPGEAASGTGVTGKLTVAGLQPGSYELTWWDVAAGKPLDPQPVTVEKSGTAELAAPSVAADTAFFLVRAGDRKAGPASRPAARADAGPPAAPTAKTSP